MKRAITFSLILLQGISIAQCPSIGLLSSVSLTNCMTGRFVTATATYSANVTSRWFAPGNVPMFSSGAATSVVHINLPGVYRVEFRDNSTNCTVKDSITASTSISRPIFELNSPSNFTSTSSGIVVKIVNAMTMPPGGVLSYTLAPAGTAVPIGMLSSISTYTLSNCGNYYAMVRDNTSQCTSSLDFIACSDFVGLKENALFEEFFDVFPNPGNGEFRLINKSTLETSFFIYAISGKVIGQGKIQGDHLFQLNKNSSGVYLLRLQNSSGSFFRKLVIN